MPLEKISTPNESVRNASAQLKELKSSIDHEVPLEIQQVAYNIYEQALRQTEENGGADRTTVTMLLSKEDAAYVKKNAASFKTWFNKKYMGDGYSGAKATMTNVRVDYETLEAAVSVYRGK